MWAYRLGYGLCWTVWVLEYGGYSCGELYYDAVVYFAVLWMMIIWRGMGYGLVLFRRWGVLICVNGYGYVLVECGEENYVKEKALKIKERW